MAEPAMFDDYAVLMDVSLTSEYDRMENLDEEILDDVVQIVRKSVVQCKRKPTKGGQFNEDFSAIIATLTSQDSAQIDGFIEQLNNQATIPCGISEAKKKRVEFSPEQILILEAGFSKCHSPDPCKCEEIAKILKMRLVKQSEDVNAWSALWQNTQNCSSSVSKSSASCNSKEFLPLPSMLRCSEQSDPQNNNQYQNTEFQDDILAGKRIITGRRLKLNPEQQQRLKEYNSDFGSTVDTDPSSSIRCKSERSTSRKDNELSNPLPSKENYSLVSSLGFDKVYPNLDMI